MEAPPSIYGYEFRQTLRDRLDSEKALLATQVFRSFKPDIIQASFWSNRKPWFVKRRQVGDEFCVFVSSGTMQLKLDDETRILKRGDLFLLPEMTPHSFGLPRGEKAVSHVIIHCHAVDFFRLLKSPFWTLRDPERFLGRLQDMLSLMEHDEASGRDYAFLLMRELMLEIASFDGLLSAGKESLDGRIETAWRFMRDNYSSNIGVSDIAASCGLHQVRFREIFKRETGFSPSEAVLRQRLREACRMLSFSDKKVRRIAEECGFGSEFYFCSVFKRKLGCRPSEYRERSAS